MPSYESTLRYLYALHARGMKFGLRTTRHLLARLGHPERRFPSVHVAGTNGKGSTCAFLASMLMEGGLRTGLYTSPHLERFTERIRVDGAEISEGEVVEVVAFLRPLIEELGATFFEVTTCVAFRHFAGAGVDAAVVETGLGGRLDATNVLRPRLCVITTIGLDHTEILGPTLRAVAREKGGIMKRGVPCITGDLPADAQTVLRGIASRKGARLLAAADLVRLQEGGAQGTRAAVIVRAAGRRIGPVRPALAGLHQRSNALLAVAAWTLLRLRRPSGWKTAAAATRGLRRARLNAGLRGRLETLGADREYTLDVAHNAGGMAVLAGALRRSRWNGHVVFGVMKDKDLTSMIGALRSVSSTLVAVRPRTARAVSVRTILREARRCGVRAVHGGTVREGLRRARLMTGTRGRILVTGSHYVVGEALSAIRRGRGKKA